MTKLAETIRVLAAAARNTRSAAWRRIWLREASCHLRLLPGQNGGSRGSRGTGVQRSCEGREGGANAYADEIDKEEDPDIEEAPQSEPPRYPRPREDLPDLPAEQQALVDGWWKDFKPFFEDRDADEMIRRIMWFMEEHPELFVHLELEHEVLFELGAEAGRRKEWSKTRRAADAHPRRTSGDVRPFVLVLRL